MHSALSSGIFNSMREKLSCQEIDRRYKRLRQVLVKKIKQHQFCHQHLLDLMEKVSVGIIQVDLAGRIIFFNQEACRITGYSREEIHLHHFRKLLSLDDLAEGFKLFYQAVQGSYPKSVLLRVLKHNRASTIMEVSAAPFYQGGKLQGAVAFVKDVSERKRLEDANRKRVETFIRFSHEMDAWQEQVLVLKKEVNDLLFAMGKPGKYSVITSKNAGEGT